RAAEVNLWACHGPDGAPLGDAPFSYVKFAGDSEVVPGCATTDDAIVARFVRTDPQGAASASLRVNAPAGLAVIGLRIERTATGRGYAVTGAGDAVLEQSDSATPLTTDLDVITSSAFARVSIECGAALGSRCSDDHASAAVRAVDFVVADVSPPK